MGVHEFNFPRTDSLELVSTITANQKSLEGLLKSHKISSSEFQIILEILGRYPTMAELGVFSAMWSEHCSYKSSRIHLKKLPTTGPQVVVGPGENAGIVRLSDKLCAAFKMESHNHPSYIEPYQGAATGVGGILRDVFCMGARPVANMNCLRFGRREHPRTHYLFENVVKGIGDYGNCVGIPTVGGNLSFNHSYDGNCLVNAMSVGLIHEDRIFKGYASGVGNLVVYVGSATGRDGIHGATMASDSFDSQQSSSQRTTVQVGDPFAEKLLLEATLELLDKNLVVGLQDMGAAGLTSSSFEMADRAESGLFLDLDRVPVRAQEMTAYELLLSESQERMLLVIEPEKWNEIKSCLDRWELSFSVIGEVTNTGRVQIAYHGVLEVDVPVAPLAGKAPVYDRPRKPVELQDAKESDLRQAIENELKKLGVATCVAKTIRETGAKVKVYENYDHHIGAKTVLGPEQQGAAVLWVRSEWANPEEPFLGLAISTSCNERYCGVDPKLGGAHAVLKSARAIAATGAVPLAVTDCLNFGNPEDPKVMEEFALGVEGIGVACEALETPVVSGNVSLYNTTDGQSILPTPMIGMIGKHADIRRAVGAVVCGEGVIGLLAPKDPRPKFGGSLIAHLLQQAAPRDGQVPPIHWELEMESMSLIRNWTLSGLTKAIRDVGEGGILTSLLKMCLGSRQGFEGHLASCLTQLTECEAYFGEFGPAYLIQFASRTEFNLAQKELGQHKELQLTLLGQTNGDAIFKVDQYELPLDHLVSESDASLLF